MKTIYIITHSFNNGKDKGYCRMACETIEKAQEQMRKDLKQSLEENDWFNKVPCREVENGIFEIGGEGRYENYTYTSQKVTDIVYDCIAFGGWSEICAQEG